MTTPARIEVPFTREFKFGERLLHPRFAAELDEAVDTLRQRLLADVLATADRECRHPGIRARWRELVRHLAAVHTSAGPPPAPLGRGLS